MIYRWCLKYQRIVIIQLDLFLMIRIYERKQPHYRNQRNLFVFADKSSKDVSNT